MEHRVKIQPRYFEAVNSGQKTYEVRRNDRSYQNGDTIYLNEWDPSKVKDGKDELGFTGRVLKFKIGFVFQVKGNQVVFSLLPSVDSRVSQ